MKQFLQAEWPLVIILIILTSFSFWGVKLIPFHPDESTQLFMSSDLEILFTEPGSLLWKPDQVNDPRQRLRELDAPITKYLLGLGRVITGQRALLFDWDWTKSWEANLIAGAYPDEKLLQTGRLTITFLLPFSLVLIYLIVKRIGTQSMGLFAVVILGTNAVVLLHGRRAMAEGALLLGVLLATWCILRAHQQPWLIGIGMALAFNTKQSTLALLPVAIFVLAWLPKDTSHRFKRVVFNLIQFSLVFILITLVLNPVFWSHTLDATHSAITARRELATQQIEDTQAIAPEKVMKSPARRVFVLFLNLFISPAEYGLVENLHPTLEDLEAYINIPGHNMFRGIIFGGIFFVLALFGLYMAVRKALTGGITRQRDLTLVLLSTLSMAGGFLVAIQIYWIRYTVPLVPFVAIWIAYGIASLVNRPSQ
jgi:4-amino-4-deoxy-L-arabinose transferase-like glycosyltransferase